MVSIYFQLPCLISKGSRWEGFSNAKAPVSPGDLDHFAYYQLAEVYILVYPVLEKA